MYTHLTRRSTFKFFSQEMPFFSLSEIRSVFLACDSLSPNLKAIICEINCLATLPLYFKDLIKSIS